MIADTLTVFNILASATKDFVCLVPQFFGNDSRNNLTRFILEHYPIFGWQEFLLLGEHINDTNLVADIITLVLGVGNNARHRGVCNLITVIVAITLFIEKLLKLFHTVFARSVQTEQVADHRCLTFVNDKSLVLFLVSENSAVAEHYT